MSFINKISTIFRLCDKNMFYIHLDDGIILDHFNSSNELVNSKKIISNKYLDFTDCYFTLDKKDNIYGIYNDKGLKMIQISNFSSITEKELLNYNADKFNISFPYIHVEDNSIHILYYIFNKNSPNSSALFHHYRHNGVWTENKIDFISHIVMDSFTVIWNQGSPIVFYYNLINGYEELFLSKFNSTTVTWSSPIQITNSKKNKLYLSVLKDSMNFYHLAYCENLGSGYAVKYENGYLNDNSLDIDVSTYISGPSTCMYPSLIKENTTLHLMWVNYGKLNTSISLNLGKEWGDHNIDEFSIEDDFVRANFFSNYTNDKGYNVSSLFTNSNDVEILGF